MPTRNLSSMSVDALLKLKADIEKTLTSRAVQLRKELSKLGHGDVRLCVDLRCAERDVEHDNLRFSRSPSLDCAGRLCRSEQ